MEFGLVFIGVAILIHASARHIEIREVSDLDIVLFMAYLAALFITGC